ncbi:hypothetical protein Goari_000666, partial [Gossypium aridum]|nr:hypothetical protein [Gossypium aridum]
LAASQLSRSFCFSLAASQPFLLFFFTAQFTTVVKSALQAIRERGLRTFLRELKDDGFTFVVPLS